MSYKEPSRIPMEKPLVRNNAYVDSGTVLSEFRNSVWSVCWKQVSLHKTKSPFSPYQTTTRFGQKTITTMNDIIGDDIVCSVRGAVGRILQLSADADAQESLYEMDGVNW